MEDTRGLPFLNVLIIGGTFPQLPHLMLHVLHEWPSPSSRPPSVFILSHLPSKLPVISPLSNTHYILLLSFCWPKSYSAFYVDYFHIYSFRAPQAHNSCLIHLPNNYHHHYSGTHNRSHICEQLRRSSNLAMGMKHLHWNGTSLARKLA